MPYLCYLCLSLPPVVCMAHVLFMLFVFVFTSSCLYGSCLIYVICVCLHIVVCFLFSLSSSGVICTQCCQFL
jgi:hypothetical protein